MQDIAAGEQIDVAARLAGLRNPAHVRSRGAHVNRGAQLPGGHEQRVGDYFAFIIRSGTGQLRQHHAALLQICACSWP